MSDNICFIDFETTGTDLLNDYPIEIGCVLVDQELNFIKEFNSYIKPPTDFHTSEKAFSIHRIPKERILDSPDETTTLNNFFSYLGCDYKFAAWNMSFDIAFFKILCVRNSFQSYLSKIDYRHLDVQTISYIAKKLGVIDSKISSLSELTAYFGLKRSLRHNALEDSYILLAVYKKLYDILSNRNS